MMMNIIVVLSFQHKHYNRYEMKNEMMQQNSPVLSTTTFISVSPLTNQQF